MVGDMPEIYLIGDPAYTYMQAANVIHSRTRAGTITGRLPAEHHLAADLGVSYQTLRRALAVLRDRGIIVTRHGRGSFVTSAHRSPAARESSHSSEPTGRRMK